MRRIFLAAVALLGLSSAAQAVTYINANLSGDPRYGISFLIAADPLIGSRHYAVLDYTVKLGADITYQGHKEGEVFFSRWRGPFNNQPPYWIAPFNIGRSDYENMTEQRVVAWVIGTVPLPAGMILLPCALAALGLRRRRKAIV